MELRDELDLDSDCSSVTTKQVKMAKDYSIWLKGYIVLEVTVRPRGRPKK